MKTRIIEFIRKETVLLISAVLAIFAMLVFPGNVVEYIDFRTLIILFGLMLVISGLKQLGIFTKMSEVLLDKLSGTRNITFVLVGLCFFTSMFITNDVALITFVPFAIELFGKAEDRKLLIKVTVLQTIAANLGSMVTPMGNPQNIYLYSVSGMSILDFMRIILPYALISLILLFAVIMLMKNGNTEKLERNKDNLLPKNKLIMYVVLFIICVLTVIRILPELVMLAIVGVTVLIFDRKAFKGVDYSLLLTFVCFFVFVGCIGDIPSFGKWLSGIIVGRETFVTVILSQIISNVPTTILLSEFTDNYNKLIVGSNLGGLGTIIASMASLISYKYYAEFDNSSKSAKSLKSRYLAVFTFWNIAFLAVLSLVCAVIGKFSI